MKISIIKNDLVKDNKAGNLAKVSAIVNFNTLHDFVKLALNFHICCGLFENNERKLSNFKSIKFLQYDFDNGTKSEEVSKILDSKNFNYIILASKNHLIDKNDGKGCIERFHLFIPLKKELTDSEFYSFLIKYLSEKWKFSIDRKAVDSTRYYFKHSKLLYIKDTLDDLNSNHYKENYSQYKIKERQEAEKVDEYLENLDKQSYIPYQDRIEAAKLYIENKVGASISGCGGNNLTFVAACVAVSCGLKDIDVIAVLNWYNDNYCKPKWKPSGLQNKLKYARKIVKVDNYYSSNRIKKILGRNFVPSSEDYKI